MSGNVEFRAAVEVLEAPFIAVRAARYVDHAREVIDFGGLLPEARSWSTSERAMVMVALSMWGRDDLVKPAQRATVSDLLHTLDSNNLNRVLRAISIRRYGA